MTSCNDSLMVWTIVDVVWRNNRPELCFEFIHGENRSIHRQKSIDGYTAVILLTHSNVITVVPLRGSCSLTETLNTSVSSPGSAVIDSVAARVILHDNHHDILI